MTTADTAAEPTYKTIAGGLAQGEPIRVEGSGKGPARIVCEVCGYTETIPLPVDMDLYIAHVKRAMREHRRCKVPA